MITKCFVNCTCAMVKKNCVIRSANSIHLKGNVSGAHRCLECMYTHVGSSFLKKS